MAFGGSVQKLVKLVQQLATARTLDEVMSLVRSAAREIAHADGATFVLKDQEFCFYADEDAISPLWKGQRFPLSTCVSGWAMMHKQQVVIEDIYQDPRIPLTVYSTTFVKSLVMTPIHKSEPLGAIGVYWSKTYTPTHEELELLQALADAVSVSIENVSLYGCLEQRIEELKKANQANEEFLMTLSHELRTPLNAILGWAEILAENYWDDSEAQLGLSTIKHSAMVQTKIIEDLLDMSYITSGRLKIDYKNVDMVEVAENIVRELRPAADKKHIQLQLESQFETAIVLGDAERLHQIVTNLISNAIKFSDESTTVTIGLRTEGPAALIEVSDQGIGMTADFVPMVFDRFKQADGSLTRRYGGLGLGLAIAQHLAYAHKGRLSARSEGLGQGSTFAFAVPLVESSLKENRTPARPHVEDASLSVSTPMSLRDLVAKNILVVDDDRDCRRLVETILKKTGASVQSAASVAEALRISEESRFDAVVCDISMPEADGFTFLDQVRGGTTPMPSQVPIIALTAFADSNTQKTALAKGFDNFLGKPFSSSHLVRTVSELTARH
jgi:two-component system CheB/CheR fusion protein